MRAGAPARRRSRGSAGAAPRRPKPRRARPRRFAPGRGADGGAAAGDRESFERAAAELIGAQRINADRPKSRAALGTFFAQRHRSPRPKRNTRRRYVRARITRPPRPTSPIFIASSAATPTANRCCAPRCIVSPQDAGLHHALGLTLVRLKQRGRSARRIGPCRRTRSQRSQIRLCLRRRAALARPQR